LYAQDVMYYARQRNSGRVKESYNLAVEAFTLAIKADPTDTINQDAKEDLEALMRLSMGGSGSPGGKSTANPRAGTSAPGEGY